MPFFGAVEWFLRVLFSPAWHVNGHHASVGCLILHQDRFSTTLPCRFSRDNFNLTLGHVPRTSQCGDGTICKRSGRTPGSEVHGPRSGASPAAVVCTTGRRRRPARWHIIRGKGPKEMDGMWSCWPQADRTSWRWSSGHID